MGPGVPLVSNPFGAISLNKVVKKTLSRLKQLRNPDRIKIRVVIF